MSALLLGEAALVLVSVAVLVLLLARILGRSASAEGAPTRGSVSDRALRRARSRALLCVGAALAMLVAGAAVHVSAPELLGLPLALTPGLASATALLGYAALPAAVETFDGPTTASLTPRTAWSYGSRRAFAVPGGIALATLGFLTWAALVADADDQGRMRSIGFSDGSLSSSSGPFPGSFYGVPLGVVTLLLAASTYLALRRIAGTPTLPDPRDATADQRWRVTATRLVTRVATAALLGYLGGAACYAGLTLRSASSAFAANGGHAPGMVLAGSLLGLAGVAVVVAGAVSAVLAVGQALTLSSATAADPVTHPVAPAQQ